MSDAILTTTGLTVGYGSGAVVRDVDLRVSAGEICVLLGPNGAGKTTTLLAVSGELPLTSGSVEFRGGSCTLPMWRRARQGLSYISADHAVIKGLSVMDNLRLSRGRPAVGLEMFPELGEHRQRLAGLLSGGQQRMLSLAMALCEQPSLLLADEMSLGLAPQIVSRLLTSIRDAADNGVAVILVEQHARKALRIADHAVMVERGRVTHRADADTMLAAIEDGSAYLQGATAYESATDPEEVHVR